MTKVIDTIQDMKDKIKLLEEIVEDKDRFIIELLDLNNSNKNLIKILSKKMRDK